MPARGSGRIVAITVLIGIAGCGGDGGSDGVGANAVEKHLAEDYQAPSCTERDVASEKKILPKDQSAKAAYAQVFSCQVEPKPGPLGETRQALVFLEKDGNGVIIYRSSDQRITGFEALDEPLK